MSIPAMSGSGFNMNNIQQQMQDKFASADVDKNQSISKTEAVDALSSSGLSEKQVDKMFSKMDANGDGEVTAQEQEEMMQQMQERMEKMKGGGASLFSPAQHQSNDLFASLLDSLSSDETEDKDSDYEDLIEQLQKDQTHGDNAAESFNQINAAFPPVNTYA